MSDFLPCPFETEPHYPRVVVNDCFNPACGDYWVAKAICTECEITMTAVGDTEDEALETLRECWNTRYQATCTVVADMDESFKFQYYCTNCGTTVPENGNYCSGCGRKVDWE